jgi:hypothetical protein
MDLSSVHFGTVDYHFWGYQDENLKFESQQDQASLVKLQDQSRLAWLCTGGIG